MPVLPAIEGRRARRAFDPRPVSREVEASLWRAVSLAPSHGNSQPVRVLVARSGATRETLIGALAAGNRLWAPAAPLLIAIASIPEHAPAQPNSDGTTREYWGLAAGIALGNLMAQATSLGLVAHPMAAFDEPAARAAFGAPNTVRVHVVVAIGYPGDPATLPDDLRARETAAQERVPVDTLVAEDRWGEGNAASARSLRERPS